MRRVSRENVNTVKRSSLGIVMDAANVDNAALQQMVSMGFNADKSADLLSLTGNNLETAIELIAEIEITNDKSKETGETDEEESPKPTVRAKSAKSNSHTKAQNKPKSVGSVDGVRASSSSKKSERNGGNANGASTSQKKMREGDWICPVPSCGDLVFGYRTACHLCGAAKPGYNVGDPAPAGGKPGDWICPKKGCHDLVFARRTKCNRCGTPKPAHLVSVRSTEQGQKKQRKLKSATPLSVSEKSESTSASKPKSLPPGMEPTPEKSKRKRRRGKRGGGRTADAQVDPSEDASDVGAAGGVDGYIIHFESNSAMLEAQQRSSFKISLDREAEIPLLRLGNEKSSASDPSKVFAFVVATKMVHGPFTPTKALIDDEAKSIQVAVEPCSSVPGCILDKIPTNGALTRHETMSLCRSLGVDIEPGAVTNRATHFNGEEIQSAEVKYAQPFSGIAGYQLLHGNSAIASQVSPADAAQFSLFGGVPPQFHMGAPAVGGQNLNTGNAVTMGQVHQSNQSMMYRKNLTAVLVGASWNRVTICHMEGGYFWVHEEVQSGDLAALEISMAGVYQLNDAKIPLDFKFLKGALFAAPYVSTSDDGSEKVTWTRVEIMQPLNGGKVQVSHMDYGSTDVVEAASLRSLSAEYVALPAQAIKCKLNLPYSLDPLNPVQAPKCEWLAHQLNGQQLLCTMVGTEPSTGVNIVDLYDLRLNSLIPWISSIFGQPTVARNVAEPPKSQQIGEPSSALGTQHNNFQPTMDVAAQALLNDTVGSDNPQLASRIQNVIRSNAGEVPLPVKVAAHAAEQPVQSEPPGHAVNQAVSDSLGHFAGLAAREGFVFCCTSSMLDESLERKLFGLPRQKYEQTQNIKLALPGESSPTALFLYDTDINLLLGVYEAVQVGLDLEPDAWQGDASCDQAGSPFPVQVKIREGFEFDPVKVPRSKIVFGLLSPAQMQQVVATLVKGSTDTFD